MTAVREKNNAHIGYLCGRLAALYEICRRASGGKMNANLFDEWYCQTLLTFTACEKRQAELPASAKKARAEKIIAEIVNQIDNVPERLTLEEQGFCALGYWHQRHDFRVETERLRAERSENVKNEEDDAEDA